MRLQRIQEAVYFRPWFISPQGYGSVRAMVDNLSDKPKSSKEEWDAFLSDFVRARPDMAFNHATGIATIHIFGVVGPHLSNIERSCGNTSYEQITSEIDQAKTLGATRINFIFDSPGGYCTGCDETAKAIAAIQEETDIFTVAFTETTMCSAAYYLAAGCSAIVATRSAMVGNVGVILPWVDSSGEWAAIGLDFQPIVNEGADLKSTMHGPSLTEAQREFLQDDVNNLGEMFKRHVSNHRKKLSNEVWRAAWYGGDEALVHGLVDMVGISPNAI